MNGLFSHYRLLAACIWLLAVALSFAWNSVDDIREKNNIAQQTARAFFEQIISSRRWNLEHGGVYVYTTEKSPPNQYLPEDRRSIRDEHQRSMTLVNPAYMTRQIAEISRSKGQVLFHITSLTPISAENRAYPWEVPWLEAFNQGVPEKGGFAEENGEKIYRYMAPLPFKKSCLPCHSPPELQGEAIRGAISVSIPIRFHKSPFPLLLSHLFVAILGMGGIFFFGGRLAQSRRNILAANRKLELEIDERRQTEKELISIKKNLEQRVDERTSELSQTNETLDRKIQEQLKIEAALVNINDEFIQIFNSAPDGMRVIDRNFNVIRANHAYCQLTGRKIEEIQGNKCHEVFPGKLCHTEGCPLTRILSGEERVEVETLKTRGDGKLFPCIITATPFREPGGKLAGIVEVSRDVSNWKKIEMSLSATAEHLRARNLELKDFAHVISHDLQEPLILIQAFGEKIRTKCADDLPQKGKDYLEHIDKSAKRMQGLINGLLIYSRVSSKANPFEPVELKSIIDSVLEDLANSIERNQAHISMDEQLATVEADPLQMRQLFQNIIGNSLKYHHSDRRPEITIRRLPFSDAYDNQNYVRISIEDNGIGFDKKYQRQIFDIFQRLHTRQQFQGTGIGLSICKKIIDRHRGTISAEGVMDQGATFTVTLPRAQQTAHERNKRDKKVIDAVINRR
ncbi:MAG: ATP-binding protein [Thermodesulfobacteriota bacterium]